MTFRVVVRWLAQLLTTAYKEVRCFDVFFVSVFSTFQRFCQFANPPLSLFKKISAYPWQFHAISPFKDCGDTSVPDATSCVARCRLPYNGTVTSAFCPEALELWHSNLVFTICFHNLDCAIFVGRWIIWLSSWQGNTDPEQVSHLDAATLWTRRLFGSYADSIRLHQAAGWELELFRWWLGRWHQMEIFLTDFWSQTFDRLYQSLFEACPWALLNECWPTGPRLHWCGGWLLWFWQHLYAQVRRFESCQPRIWHWKLQKSWPIQWNCICELGKGWRSVAVIPLVPVLCLLQMSVNLCGALVHSESIEIRG